MPSVGRVISQDGFVFSLARTGGVGDCCDGKGTRSTPETLESPKIKLISEDFLVLSLCSGVSVVVQW